MKEKAIYTSNAHTLDLRDQILLSVSICRKLGFSPAIWRKSVGINNYRTQTRGRGWGGGAPTAHTATV